MTTTTEDILLQDIALNPNNHTLRLIYADWLDDNNRSWRAEFIRLQLRSNYTEVEHEVCQRRLGELMDEHGMGFFMEVAPWLSSLMRQTGKRSVAIEGFDLNLQGYWLGGMLHEVRCSRKCWLEYGVRICRRNPVGKVVLTGLDPCPWGMDQTVWGRGENQPHSGWIWIEDDRLTYRHWLPTVIFKHVRGDGVERAAHGPTKGNVSRQVMVNEANRAALAWVREELGITDEIRS